MAIVKKTKTAQETWEEAQIWHKERNGIRCDLCAVNCFLSKDKVGVCGMRKNVGNSMVTSNGALKAMVVDTVEKRPLFHFHPGAKSLSISGDAPDNWRIEHDRLPKVGRSMTPEQVVKMAEKEGVEVISYTYGEPSLFFEYMAKVAKLAHRSSIKNVLSTTGVISEEAIKRVAKYIDAAVVNFKASGNPEFMASHQVIKSPEPIFDALKQLKKQRVHLEITNTIIPQIGDNVESCTKLAEHIVAELAPTVPFHLLQFHPTVEKFSDLPFTPMSTLEACAKEANRAGLRYVYIGNMIEPNDAENTFCYNCRELLIQRVSGNLKKNVMQKDRCSGCGVRIDVVI
ncbi:MAG: radical SAM protein [Candidatus Aenigmarchaeota archaeon]|nr:radical SAM protein [Candidatus Aenigmarchaeota archaeon]